MKVLAVDPGEKRIGIAISDSTGTIARPLCVIVHEARQKDAKNIVEIAKDEGVEIIVIGQALDKNDEVGYQARKSLRLADAIRAETDITVEMWDETGTTREAAISRAVMGVSKKKRQGHFDDIAASILLQDFLIVNEKQIKGGDADDEKTK